MTPRIYIDRPLAAGDALDLPTAQTRHVQVLRLQPGDPLTLFNGAGGEWQARVTQMARSGVGVRIEAHANVDRELARHVTLALGMPANERMDALVEKATELGVAVIQPLVCERSVLRLAGERAVKRLAHWRGITVAASEQCGRTQVPEVRAVLGLPEWVAAATRSDEEPGSATEGARKTRRFVLSPNAATQWRSAAAGPAGTALVLLSGPEGGLSAAERELAVGSGFMAVSLGARVLRADTAPLAVLAWCGFESGLVVNG